MKVSIINNNLSFKAAKLNILAQSDSHGMMLNTPQTELTIKKNKDEIFDAHDHYDKKKVMDPKSVVNMYVHAGDFSINQCKRGYLTHPDMCSGDLQIMFAETMAKIARDSARNSIKNPKNNSEFYALRTLGNHDFDDGDNYIINKVKDNTTFTTILSNVNLSKSPIINKLFAEKNPNIVESKVISVPDDKTGELRKVLFLGVTIPTMKFYNPKLLENMEFLDDCNKKDAKLKKEDLKGTINAVKVQVDKFKKENPNGAVVLLSHTGNIISDMIREDVPQINLILNGHDHKSKVGHEGKTAIHSLGKDNTILKSFHLYFDDDGKLVRTDEDIHVTDKYNDPAKTKYTISNYLLEKYLSKDLDKKLSPITYIPDDDNLYPQLKYNEEQIRSSNSPLANCLTTRIASTAREELAKKGLIRLKGDLASVGLQSSSIRAGIKPNMTNLDMMKIFDGVSERLAGLEIGDVTGEQLVELIRENVSDNLDAPTRNTLLQWSDIKINRTLIKDIREGLIKRPYSDAVEVRNYDTQEWEPINLNKKYVIMLPSKYLDKTDIKSPPAIRGSFVDTGYTMDTLFRKSIRNNETISLRNLNNNNKILEERIL